MAKNVYSVRQVNAYIKNMFVQDFMLNRIYVKGEVSNCKYHTSGHIYFSLKDESGAIACVMFAGERRTGLTFRMQEGQKVIVLGSVSVYERDGRYQDVYKRQREGQNVDMMLCNYIYDKQGAKHKKAIRYANVFPQDQVFTWKDAKHFHLGQYILMHSVIYRTQMLKNCGLELPQHTFYVDNIFVYYPLPYVKNLYYMDLDLYLSLIHI